MLLMQGPISSPSVQQAAAIGGPFRLTAQDGGTFTDQDLKGRPFLVFFGFTHCPEVCPTTLFEISEILRKLLLFGLLGSLCAITATMAASSPKQQRRRLAIFWVLCISVAGGIELRRVFRRNDRHRGSRRNRQGSDRARAVISLACDKHRILIRVDFRHSITPS